MSAGFTRAQIDAIAALANLELDPGEVDRFARQLGEILAYASEIQQVDTAGIPPTAHIVGRRAADRADDVRPSLETADALANAPDAALEHGLFRVPRVLG